MFRATSVSSRPKLFLSSCIIVLHLVLAVPSIALADAVSLSSADAAAIETAHLHYDFLTGEVILSSDGRTGFIISSDGGNLLAGGNNLGGFLDDVELPFEKLWFTFHPGVNGEHTIGLIIEPRTDPRDLSFYYQGPATQVWQGDIFVSNLPEPSSIVLAMMALLGLLAQRRRRRHN